MPGPGQAWLRGDAGAWAGLASSRGSGAAVVCSPATPARSAAPGRSPASLRPQCGQDARRIAKNTHELMRVTQFLLSVLSRRLG